MIPRSSAEPAAVAPFVPFVPFATFVEFARGAVAPLAVALALALVPAAAAAQPAPPAAAPAPPSSKLPRIVLVEANGPGPEIEAFIDRFRFEGEERETFALSDARLSGASFSALASEPDGETARAFRREWPGPVWISANLSGCDPKVVVSRIPDQTSDGYRYERVIVNASVECKVEVRRLEPDRPGKPETVTFSGSAALSSSTAGLTDEPMQEAARTAATKAAKKLAPKKR